MRRLIVAGLGALLLGAAPVAPVSAQTIASARTSLVWPGTNFAMVPPAPQYAQDPADSLYRAAREALNQGENVRAAELFQSIHRRHPRSAYAADALYWEAFARYRVGGSDQLRSALALLERQGTEHPNAATGTDARALASRVQGELARLGDAEAAATVTKAAVAATQVATEREVAGVGRQLAEASRTISAMGRETAAIQREVAAAQREAAATARAMARGARSNTDPLPEGCSREDAEIRSAALNALLQTDAERALPVLRQVLTRRDPCSTPLRRTAVFLVSQKATPETEAVLLDVARGDPDRQVRGSAVFYLSQVGSDEAASVLEEILRTPADSALQEQALFALAQHRGERARRTLRDYASRNDVPTRLRSTAIFWVGQDPAPDNLAFLQNLYRQLRDEQLKQRVLFSISQRAEPARTRWLLGVAHDTTELMKTRTTALYHAGTNQDVPVGEFLELYDRLPDRKLKEQLIYLFAQRSEPAAFDKLSEVARREPEIELRKQAIHWISQSRDPRAATVLLEIIGGT
jgi:hypothetical protein